MGAAASTNEAAVPSAPSFSWTRSEDETDYDLNDGAACVLCGEAHPAQAMRVVLKPCAHVLCCLCGVNVALEGRSEFFPVVACAQKFTAWKALMPCPTEPPQSTCLTAASAGATTSAEAAVATSGPCAVRRVTSSAPGATLSTVSKLLAYRARQNADEAEASAMSRER